MNKRNRVVITAGYGKSLHSIALMHKLLNSNIEIVGCVQVKTFQFSRFKVYLNQYGWKTLKSKFISYVLGSKKTHLKNELIPIKKYIFENNIITKTVRDFCLENNLKFIKVNSLNSSESINFVKNNSIDLIVYSGGGILRKSFIKSSKKGIINAHSGYLPFIRGMNAIEWSLFYNYKAYTTIHFIDIGIDTGRILYREMIPFNTDLYTYRGNATLHNIYLIAKVLSNFDYYDKNSTEQKKSDGRQFYVMHESLKEIVSNNINNKNESHLVNNYEKFNF